MSFQTVLEKYRAVTFSQRNLGDRFERPKGQKDTILYNTAITVSNIPEKAYQYVINGKSAIEWIMDRYQVTTDKTAASGMIRMTGPNGIFWICCSGSLRSVYGRWSCRIWFYDLIQNRISYAE